MRFQTVWELDRCLPVARLSVAVYTTTGAPAPAAVDPIQVIGTQRYEALVTLPDDCFVGYAVLADSMTGESLAVCAINSSQICSAARAALLDTTVMGAATANDGSIAGALIALSGGFNETDANF